MERLHITQWNKLSKDSRLKALQSLERHYAQLQGRDAWNEDQSKAERKTSRLQQKGAS